MLGEFEIVWHDSGREPHCPPNPNFPNGISVDASDGAAAACDVDLPYPAKRIGSYIVICKTCGLKVGITTAGRPDDPKHLRLACKAPLN